MKGLSKEAPHRSLLRASASGDHRLTVAEALALFREADLLELAAVGALAGLFTNSAIVAMYAMFARSFPTELRARGPGLVIGVGRGGAALGPISASRLAASCRPIWAALM